MASRKRPTATTTLERPTCATPEDEQTSVLSTDAGAAGDELRASPADDPSAGGAVGLTYVKEGGDSPIGEYKPVFPASGVLVIDPAKLPPELARQLQQHGIAQAGPITIDRPKQAAPGTPSFALRRLLIRNMLTRQQREFCLLPRVPREEWPVNFEQEEVINGEGLGEEEVYDLATRDAILKQYGSHFDPLHKNDQGPPVRY